MEDIRIEVDGITELRQALRRVSNELPKELTGVHRKMAEIVVRDALPNVPVGETGNLRKSVKALATQARGAAKAGSAVSVPYAPAVHWGTGPRPGLTGPHNIARRPFLWNALNKHRSQVEEEFEKAIDDLLDRAIRGR